VSKVRKNSRTKYDASELFADEDFDAEEFVDLMEDKKSERNAGTAGGWRRIEEIRESKRLRAELQDLEDWYDLD
jgi:hypothetical protein